MILEVIYISIVEQINSYRSKERLLDLLPLDFKIDGAIVSCRAFNNETRAQRCIIPNFVTVLQESAFQNCKYLSIIHLTSSLQSIESNAFKGCTSIETIEIPLSVVTIGKGAFEECVSLLIVKASLDSYIFRNKHLVPSAIKWVPT